MNRRDLIKMAVAGGATGVIECSGWSEQPGAATDKPQVKIAGYAYDRVPAI